VKMEYMVPAIGNCDLDFAKKIDAFDIDGVSPGLSRKMYYEPMFIDFFQFQSPKWSSMVSRRDPGPISRVLAAIGSMFDHPRSGASPSVRPTHRVRLNENELWQR
jgi:hypothetical protein